MVLATARSSGRSCNVGKMLRERADAVIANDGLDSQGARDRSNTSRSRGGDIQLVVIPSPPCSPRIPSRTPNLLMQ